MLKVWEEKGGKFDADTKTITFATDELSKFAVVKVKAEDKFADIDKHWARDDVKEMFKIGLVYMVLATQNLHLIETL